MEDFLDAIRYAYDNNINHLISSLLKYNSNPIYIWGYRGSLWTFMGIRLTLYQ